MADLTRILFFVSIFSVAACGPSGRDNDTDANNGPKDAPCPTSVSGKVYAPNGTLPLYNVLVYVPQAEPPPFPAGVQCGSCSQGIPGGAIVSTQTDAEGKFKLEGVPEGTNVPLIISTGKWRRKFTVPLVTKCQDTAMGDGSLRLPKNRTEGDMPKIAQVTGGCDALACILSKMGIDSTEFGTDPNGPQAVTFYNGSGGSAPGTPQPSTALWANLSELRKFDLVINSCECDEHNENKTAPDFLRQYADMGGRVFGSHFHYTWTKNLIPQWQGTASWTPSDYATPDLVDTSHPSGQALAQWLVTVGASTTMGQIPLSVKTHNAGPVNPPTVRWLYSSGVSPTTHYMSFQTPVGSAAENQCGKVVYAGMHVSSSSQVNASFPSGCTGTLTPDEKALVFLLFDLQACNQVIF